MQNVGVTLPEMYPGGMTSFPGAGLRPRSQYPRGNGAETRQPRRPTLGAGHLQVCSLGVHFFASQTPQRPQMETQSQASQA